MAQIRYVIREDCRQLALDASVNSGLGKSHRKKRIILDNKPKTKTQWLRHLDINSIDKFLEPYVEYEETEYEEVETIKVDNKFKENMETFIDSNEEVEDLEEYYGI